MEWTVDIFRVISVVIAWAIPAILVLAVAVFVLAAPVLTLAGLVSLAYDKVSSTPIKGTETKRQRMNLECTIDTDCPPGCICVAGRCVPEKDMKLVS
ncbi:MAG: hypothetical protein PHY28_09690 [Dehalococcoidales bacterium]|nr:hypothetical protein [Dehalococcoidales bacterium]